MPMLKSFSVTNFKNFKNKLTIDFSLIRNYDFNTHLIKNQLINKSLIYGFNATGKSNLGFAIMDINNHLTDKTKLANHYINYLNADSSDSLATFEYVFLDDDGVEIKYIYKKRDYVTLASEEIYVNGELKFSFNFLTGNTINYFEETKSIVFENKNATISAVKYMRNNTQNLPKNSPIETIVSFAEGMLWFRSIKANEFMGNLEINSELISNFIIENNYLEDFESFLRNNGIFYKLSSTDSLTGQKIIVANFQARKLELFSVMSTGTASLTLLYYWIKKSFDNISFLYLDEFDAHYHTSLSKSVLQLVNDNSNFQSVLTTHNAYLADNSFMRPDCYLIIKNGEIKSFADRTKKIIRKGHSLEHMLLTDEFE